MPQSNNSDHLLSRIEKLNSIGIALSSEKDSSRLQEMILTSAKAITQSDGSTLYTVGEDNHLHFEIIRATSLDIKMGGPEGEEVNFEPIPMYLPSGAPNDHKVVVYAALHDKTVNIPDVYEEQSLDFSGPKNFDKNTGYRSRSFLAVPMKNHENDIIGVLQLINKQESGNGDIVPYTREDQQLAESLASQAAVALTNKKLIDSLQTLFDSFIKSIATGIDEKSAYAGGHCNRVPALAMMLANAANRENSGLFKRFSMSEDERYSLEVASWLHDCGKVTTPEYVVDKATKLETIFDRIHLIDTRFEVLKRDAHIRKLERLLQADEEQKQAIEKEYQEEIRQIWSDMEFIRKINHGVESMNPDDKERARQIGKRTWANNKGEHEPFLSEDELSNLQITTGTLTLAEHEILKNHVNVSIKILDALPFPKHMRHVREYAGAHHERMDGKGYPYGLTMEQMSVPARILAIADIFEALTAKDRPYKKASKLSESLRIMGFMKLRHHIDPDLFDVFINQRVYLDYAKQFLAPELIDIREPSEIPGYPFTREDDLI